MQWSHVTEIIWLWENDANTLEYERTNPKVLREGRKYWWLVQRSEGHTLIGVVREEDGAPEKKY